MTDSNCPAASSRPIDTWLLVWAGPGDETARAHRALERVPPRADDAHVILSREVAGDRWSLLLVHYTKLECDAVVATLSRTWSYGFVNAVVDLGDA